MRIYSIDPGTPTIEPWIIAVIAGGTAVVLAVVLFFLIKFVFIPNKMKREIRDLDRRFQYLHSLLIGQDAQCIKRLEIVSRTNLLYVDIHTRYLKKFKEVRDKHDSHAQQTINHLKDLVDEKRFKQLKEALSDARDTIASYEKEVNSLNNDLLRVIKPEEDCRQASLTLKENLRRVKQDYYAKEGDLQLVKESFDVIFEHIESLFSQFEEYVESAQYEDANEILPQVDSILKQVTAALNELPNLCALVVSIIPERISSLENAYEIMIRDQYPLNHLLNNQTFKEMRSEVAALTTKIKQFNLAGVSTELDNMLSRIEEYFRLFEDEKAARTKFEGENDEIYRVETVIERRFIKLCNNVPEVAKVYVINEEHRQNIEQIRESINRVGNLKRVLDTYIHTVPRRPFTTLVEKMDELKEASNEVIQEMDDFSNYLVSLKNDSQNAYQLITVHYFKLKEAEETIHIINNPNIEAKYAEQISRSYELINLINGLLYTAPINVDQVNEYAKELCDIGQAILDKDGAIAQDHNMMILAENAIIYANRSRADFSNVNQLLAQAEVLFNNGEFEQAYISAGNVLQNIRNQSE